jgi:prepilin peptidase CpaA
MTWPPAAPQLAVVVVAALAAASDLRSRRLPNALTFGAAVVALAVHFALSGWSGLAFALAGWALGLAVFLPVYALGGMGAGDVKLLAAFGAWLGPMGVLWTALYGAIAGGVLALVVSIASGYTKTAFGNLRAMLMSWFIGGVRPVDGMTLASSRGPRLPYAVPLAAGAMVTLWMHY